MILSTQSDRLNKLCRELEGRTREVSDLSEISLEVAVVSEFDYDERIRQLIPDNPARFNEATEQIEVKDPIFFERCWDDKIAIVMHEVGEAFRAMKQLHPLESTTAGALLGDVLVDRLVCEWGFVQEITNERGRSLGHTYASCLNLWSNMDEYRKCMSKWWAQKRAGILK